MCNGVKPTVNCRLWVILISFGMIRYIKLISDIRCTTVMEGVDNGGSSSEKGSAQIKGYGKSLYLLFNFATNLKLLRINKVKKKYL